MPFCSNRVPTADDARSIHKETRQIVGIMRTMYTQCLALQIFIYGNGGLLLEFGPNYQEAQPCAPPVDAL